ncbi:ATP-dependent helicase [uncultured Desulfovibrio sp.]|uniref:ATP-dependent helicase n=1 Tax=uncultured Desulfovibrio sp. TaxID=167968 RepID=UPI002672B490|nr:ATP-dependent helicase [uncultured Desulfovibrio sp.]
MIDYAQALNEAQYAAATSGDGPVLVVAGAGSGKTRTIVYRLAWLAEHGVAPTSILLLTFTRKAAQEMLQRAGMLLDQGLSGVQGGTFHAFAYGVLRRWRPAWLGERPFTVMDSADITAAVKYCKDELKLGRGDRSFPKTQSIVGLLSKARNKELSLEEVLRREAFHLLPHTEALAALGEAYTAYRREKGLLDYDDLLFELETLLRENQAAAEALRLRFSHILVDEYQDTNLVQARIMRLLAGPPDKDANGGETTSITGNVMAVGDEAQSIYAFRGANVRNILDFPKLFPGTRIIRLEENYRSTKPVLDVANSLLAHAAESFRKTLFTRKEGGDPVRLVTPLSDMSQAKLVVRRIEELLDTHLPHEIAVLFRAGFHSYNLEMALNQTGIPFRKYGGLRYTEAAHVKDVIAYARLVLNPLDLPAFARVAALHSGIGPKTVQKLYAVALGGDAKAVEKAFARHPDLLEDMRFVDDLRARPQSPAALFGAVLEHYRPRLESTYPEDWPRRQQGLEEIIQMAAGYSELDLFVADLALESPEEDENDGEGRITLSTVHSAKGLEWNAVLIIDLVEDRFPSRHALARPEDFEEERRLMYVACTRARQDLELYAPAAIYSRAERGSLHVSQSPFVRELSPGLTEEWVEGFGGILSRRGSCFSGVGGVRGRLLPPARQAVPAFPGPAGEGTAFDDCQLLPESGSVSPFQAEVQDSADDATSPTASTSGTARLCHCRHRIFGRGKIIKHLPPDKVQVNFPGFGLKVILTEYLLMEN